MSDTKFEEAKAKLLENLDTFTADLRAKIEAVESLEMLESQSSEVQKVTDEMMKDVTGGIVNTGVEYVPYSPGAVAPPTVPPSRRNEWAHQQNALIMKQNCAQMAHNARMFFTGRTGEIDNHYEDNYWPVDSGK